MTPPAGWSFADREAAGLELAAELHRRFPHPGPGIVLALPRGGVPVAAPVAAALALPLDVLIVRKIGVPGHEELAMGAIAAFGDDVRQVRNDRVLGAVHVTDRQYAEVLARESAELSRRTRLLRGDRRPPDLAGLVILVDDGLATGSTMKAAIAAVRGGGGPDTRVVAAVPVGATDSCAELARLADEVVCLRTPEPFRAVGQAYRDFAPPGQGELRTLLHPGPG